MVVSFSESRTGLCMDIIALCKTFAFVMVVDFKAFLKLYNLVHKVAY